MTRIIFIGAGGVGSYLGGWLAHTGHDVTIFDPWAEQVEKVRADGIVVTGPHDTFTARPRMFHLHESEKVAREEPFEIGFVAMKAYDTPWAARFVDAYVRPEGHIVSAQNCWPDPMVAEAVGEGRAVGLVMSNISVEMWKAGEVGRPGGSRQRDIGHDVFRVGEHDGSDTERLHELIALLDPIDAGKVTTNLWGERWGKLSQNCMGNPVVGVSDMGTAELATDPRGRELQIRLAVEAATVGLKLGLAVVNFGGAPAASWAKADKDKATYAEFDGMIAARSNGPNRRPSMGQDVVKGRHTEIRYMNGYVLQKAEELGIDVPVNRSIVEAILAIDAGTLKPARANIEMVLSRAGY